MPRKSQKKVIIEKLFLQCKKKNNFIFTNDDVKTVLSSIGSSTNPYDMTKIDNTSILPELLLKENYCIVHLGNGRHKFIKGINKIYHNFEEINENEIMNWPYRPSIINDFSKSESGVLSLCYNHRIIHDFLYQDISASPKIYNSERKNKISFKYSIGSTKASFEKLQIEIDLTAEYLREVTVFEGKISKGTNWIENFNVYQLYNPFRYFTEVQEIKKIEKISSCYLIRKEKNNEILIRVYKYVFTNPDDITSLKLLKKREYRLKRREFDEEIYK